MQDARATSALLAFFGSPNPTHRAEAADAFASVQAPAARGPPHTTKVASSPRPTAHPRGAPMPA